MAARKYFIQATDVCQQGQTEKQTEGRQNYKKRKAEENILSKPPTDIRRNRQKNRQRADEIANRRKKFQKEDGGRKYFIQATDGRQKGQTEKETEGR